MPQDRVDEMTWEDFKTEVYDKYIPKSYRKTKAAEFYNLTQGRLTVTEYDRALCDMTRYAPEQADTDEKLADKFHEGLRHEIKMALAVHGRLTYAEALALALDVEAAMPKERNTGNISPALPPPQYSRDKRRWDEGRTLYDNKRYRPTPSRAPYGGGQTSFNQRSDPRARPPQCNVCVKYHFGECRMPNPIRCFSCGGNGHVSRECPSRNAGNGGRQNHQGFRQPPRAPPMGPGANRDQPQRQQQPFRPRPPAQARAYAVNQTQPRNEQGKHENGNLVGIGEILDTPIVILFDTGASHSFISELCVHTLNLPACKYQHRMMVSSPVGGTVEISRTCSNLEFALGERKLVGNGRRRCNPRNGLVDREL
ncbi:uncharacterized protein LOC125206552 [Salvia hispanica]|uniref:uncharacterized protein LOC125206552 n=1 Tax=Salvia hispanica TaxID=49212 RepID=UPI002009DB6F|nr:uncharacterized protein LOC125206552 [Salvia hispanica]